MLTPLRRPAGISWGRASGGRWAMAEIALHMQPKPKVRRGPGRPFAKGQSGNAAGKAPGTKNRATLLAEQLLDGEASALARKAVEMALRGDAAALRLCLERV